MGVICVKVLLIDGHSLAFRAFFALPMMNAPDGTPTNAILGFMNMLLKAGSELMPDVAAVFFDPKGGSIRGEIYADYKAGRAPTPDEFKQQMPLLIELLNDLGYPVIIREGAEADDVIASTARALGDRGDDAVILSADKDLMQILGDGVTMLRPSKGVSDLKKIDADAFTEEYGFAPRAMADYLALVGDSVDNIPGVKGIGDKSARELLSSYGSMAAIYDDIENVPQKWRTKLEAGREDAQMSLRLALPLEVPPADDATLKMSEGDPSAAFALCSRLGLKKLIERLDLSPSVSEKTAISQKKISAGEEADMSLLGSLRRAAAVFDGDRIVVMSDDGRWCRATIDDVAKWVETPENELIISGIREWSRAWRDIRDHTDSLFDIAAAHYFYHPDAKSGAVDIEGRSPQEICADMISVADDLISRDGSEAMIRVQREIDLPLVPVLCDLQDAGIYADLCGLKKLRVRLLDECDDIERKMFAAAGTEINLNSPKQVGELLFEQLHLPVIKRTKTGYSTDVSVLEELASLPEPLCEVPKMLIRFREHYKMLSGFVDPFIEHAGRAGDGIVHSTFLCDATGTGRLASRDPNVQNLPVFGSLAEDFRACIKPREAGHLFIAADYSQVELRVLAHLSGERRLIEAFAEGRDIHRETASWVFGVPNEEVSAEQRRFAKTVNFGLIYGMSAHGLAARMGISRGEASGMIERYFSVLPEIRAYIEHSKEAAKRSGHTLSMFGRIRPISEALSSEGRGGQAADRIAVNTPIQSAASDIAKIAMIKLSKKLRETQDDIRMVLQVHDSIVCEVSEKSLDRARQLLVETMESAESLTVPLKAEPKIGASLAEI